MMQELVAKSGDTDAGPAEKGADSAGLALVAERLDESGARSGKQFFLSSQPATAVSCL